MMEAWINFKDFLEYHPELLKWLFVEQALALPESDNYLTKYLLMVDDS